MTEYFDVEEIDGWEPLVWGVFDPQDKIWGFFRTKEDAEQACAEMNAERLRSLP